MSGRARLRLPEGLRPSERVRTRLLAAFALVLAFATLAVGADRLWPPDLSRLADPSTVVADRSGMPLRIFTTTGGLWRLPVDPEAVSPTYLRLLLDVEDKRFWRHPGFDPLSLLRASWQWLTHGRVVSGGSTITMQVVRLLEPRPRTLRSKLIEIFRAAQLEAHLGKDGILRAYLALAPMGRNFEGVRTGSLAWFGKEPRDLSDAEAALLVALPQSPTRLRPDKATGAALLARAKILRRGVADGVLAAADLSAALAAPMPERHRPMPMLAPHRAEQMARGAPHGTAIATTLDRDIQMGIERLLAQTVESLPRPVNLAAIVADWRSGEILARAGSAGYFDARRSGAVDMTRATRSPGSTLKPFIYGMAFEGLLAHPGSLVRDAATRFDDYAPHNFNGGFNGDVTIREALQMSLNLPAVMVLQRVGPVAFAERFKTAGLPFDLGASDVAPGLPIALGGVGITLEHLVTAYAALANGGQVTTLSDEPGVPALPGGPLMNRPAADAVTDILAGVPPPDGFAARAGRIAFKTGTSYRFRDGWAVGFDGSRVIGVWMGRADGGSCMGCVGVGAAGVLFRLFDLLRADPLPRRALAPVFAAPPPPALVRLRGEDEASADDRPHIAFPIADSRVLVDLGIAQSGPVKLAATGGQRPYRWLVDGQPVESRPFARDTLWRPEGEGFSTVTVVDAAGHSDRATVRVMGRGTEEP